VLPTWFRWVTLAMLVAGAAAARCAWAMMKRPTRMPVATAIAAATNQAPE
jgi:hypothetical protein